MSLGHRVVMLSISSTSEGQLLDCVRRSGARAVLGIHAYRAGSLLLRCPVPYVIIMGGTDANVFLTDPERASVMCDALSGAGAVVSFTDGMRESIGEMMGACGREAGEVEATMALVRLVPQAVEASRGSSMPNSSVNDDFDMFMGNGQPPSVTHTSCESIYCNWR